MATYDSPTDVAFLQKARSASLNNLDAAVAAAFARLPHEDELTGGTGSWGTDTGTANTYLVELPYPPSSYVDGLEVSFRPLNTNTGASTINVNSLGVKTIKRSGDLELYAGDLSVGLPVQLRFSTATDCFHFVNTIVREGSVSGNEADIASNAAGLAANVIDTATNTSGVATNAITTANFDTRNDRDDTAITLSTIGISGGAVDHTINTDGSADISLDWTWTGTETDIDGFIVYVRGSSSSASYTMGTTPAEEVTFHCMADRRSFILKGIGADLHWTWGVSAYRIVDPDVAAAGKLASAVVQPSLGSEDPYQPSANIAFGGDVTGTVNSQAVSEIIYHNGTKLVKTDDSGVDADDLDESATKKWAAETGANVALNQLSGTGVNVCNARYSSFEEASKPPTVETNGTVTQSSAAAFFGGNSLKMAASAADHFCYLGLYNTTYNVKITPNKKWIISAYVYANAVSKSGQLYIKTSDGNHSSPIDFTTTVAGYTWKRVSGVIDLSSNSNTTCIIRLDNDGGNGVDMYWDGIMLEEQLGTLEVPSAYVLPSAIISGWDSQADETGTNTAADAAVYTGASIAVGNTDAKCTNSLADQTSVNTAADAAAYTGTSISTTKTDAKCTVAAADQTSANNQGVSWLNEAVGSVLPVANTDAKCTDATADKTSTHTAADASAYTGNSLGTVTTGVLQNAAGTFSLNLTTGKLTINLADGLEITASGGVKVTSGGDITWLSTASDIAAASFQGPATQNSRVSFIGADKDSEDFLILPILNGEVPLRIGNIAQAWEDIKLIGKDYCTVSPSVTDAGTFYIGEGTLEWAAGYICWRPASTTDSQYLVFSKTAGDKHLIYPAIDSDMYWGATDKRFYAGYFDNLYGTLHDVELGDKTCAICGKAFVKDDHVKFIVANVNEKNIDVVPVHESCEGKRQHETPKEKEDKSLHKAVKPPKDTIGE